MSRIREDADKIIAEALRAALPDTAVAKALEGREFGPGRLVMGDEQTRVKQESARRS